MAQGYVIAHPMQAEELPAWSARWRPSPQWAGVTPFDPADRPRQFPAFQRIDGLHQRIHELATGILTRNAQGRKHAARSHARALRTLRNELFRDLACLMREIQTVKMHLRAPRHS